MEFYASLDIQPTFSHGHLQIQSNVITVVLALAHPQLRMNFNQCETYLGMDLCLVVQARIWRGGGNFKEFVRNLQLSYENNTCDRIIHALAIDGP